MAACEYCQLEMTIAHGCTADPTFRRGARIYRRVRFRRERQIIQPLANFRCRDCGALPGGLHHLGCVVEECPRCRASFPWCGCTARRRAPSMPHLRRTQDESDT